MTLAAGLSNGQSVVIRQWDTFYTVPRGRLKLRAFPPEDNEPAANWSGELIAYDRPDHKGPKTSHYSITPVTDALGLGATLARSLSVLGEVKKTRTLFLVGQTRVHFDRVKGLGDFIELEVVLREGQSEVEAQTIAAGLMADLGIRKKDLIAVAYLDMVLALDESRRSLPNMAPPQAKAFKTER